MRITLFNPDIAAEWTATLAERDSLADVYFQPAYLTAVEASGEGVARALLVEDGPQWLYVPFLLTERQIRGANYGGPLGAGASDFLGEAWRQIEAIWRYQAPGAREAFLRLHPLMDQRPLLPGWTVTDNRETVSMAGAAPKNHRNAVTQASRIGLVCRRAVATADALARDFLPLYAAAMERKDAAAGYRFGPAYFDALLALGPALRLYLIPGVAVALAMFGPVWAHYHLAARAPDAPGCAMSLLLESIAIDAREAGLEAVHLGGGLTADPADSLLAFKKRAGAGRHTFRIAVRELG